MKRFVRFLAGAAALALLLTCGMGAFASCPPVLRQYGDLDWDGHITATDARLVLQAAVGKLDGTVFAQRLYLADVDGDDKITATDARLVLQAALFKRNYSCVGVDEDFRIIVDGDGTEHRARVKPKLTRAYGGER